ncbi:MAG: diacylglycerol/lipid kinase family protein [Acidimicrobiales bacterium]
MRAQLIINSEARGVTPVLKRVIRAALEARLKLEVEETRARDAAIEVARAGAEAGGELIIAFGGDGLVNEVINGIVGSEATLAIIPGGTMNVLARNQGIPRNPLEATDHLLSIIGEVDPRLLPLGQANHRYFGFACGCGFDAEVAARVESHKPAKRKFGEPYFYGAALMTLLRLHLFQGPYLHCEGSFGTRDVAMVISLTSSGPYAYLAGRPVYLAREPAFQGAPEAEGGLSVFFLRRMGLPRLPLHVAGTLTGHFGRDATALTRVDEFTVSCGRPIPYHVDGEPLEPADRVQVRAAPETLRLLA